MIETEPVGQEAQQEQLEDFGLGPDERDKKLIVRWIKETLSQQFPNYQSHMWTPEILANCKKFLFDNGEDRIFFWVETIAQVEYLVSSMVLTKETKRLSGQDCFMYFLKYTEKKVVLTEDNVDDHIVYGVIPLDDNMKGLLNQINSVTLPKFLRDKEWPENIKKDLLEQTHKFMANLTEMVSQRKGATELYIPIDNMEDDTGKTDMKDRNHRLKEVLSHWTKQIRDLINNQTNQSDSDNAGPLEEIADWSLRRDNLINIKKQLEQAKLKRILDILKQADPKNLSTFNDLVNQITGGAEESEDNLKYLQSLKGPCTEMAKATPSQIVTILPRILNCVRLIKEKSKFYNADDKISGLLRKISNEIINRCKKCISLDDMLRGDVHKCIRDLREAISCGNAWRSIYDETVVAIRKRGGEWKIKPDSIFAQIEAFNQRCYDLIEICEGQIQFARKGREVDLPRFSGSKGPEIIVVLEEIKNSFTKYLERIEGSDRDKILDINSIKWQDDYSAFKSGTKNLEIMYLNLINFAFEHVNKLSQAVEYMEAFYDLAQKQTIKSHVEKQISKVNEIFKKEMEIADSAAKKPFSLPFGQGKASGESIWIRSLLYRIEKLKRQYDALAFLKHDTRQTEEQYNRVEKNLLNAMKEPFLKLKAEADQYEESIEHLEHNKIFVNSDDYSPSKLSNPSDPKTKPVMIEAKAIGKFHIESNFHKMLLRLLIEVPAYKKLLRDSIGNFSAKIEAHIGTRRETLRVIRETVMTAVRDYNLVHDMMDGKEKQLFEQHLSKLSEQKDKGTRSTHWKSVTDLYVKKMKSQCADIYISLMQFKHAKAVINDKISEISKYNQFIQFDTKEPYEIDPFVAKQTNNQTQISTKIQNTFSEIKKILTNTFEDFVDKKSSVHVAWFEFVRTVDKKIEDELKKTVGTSFREFCKAITGDKKTQNNPVQLFKVYIVILRSTKDADYDLVFDPKMSDLIDKVNSVLNKSVDVVGKLKHIETDMLEIRTRRVQELIEKQEEEKKRGMKNEDAVEYIPDNGFLLSARKSPPSFKEVVSSDVKSVISEISNALNEQSKLMIEYMSPWKGESFKKVWTEAKKEYFNQMLKDMETSMFREQIEFFEQVQTSIKNEQASNGKFCIFIDSSKIRAEVNALCEDALRNLLTEIMKHSQKKLQSLYNEFKKVTNELNEPIEDLVSLANANLKLEEFTKNRGKIETTIPQLEEMFKLLEEYMASIPVDDMKNRQALPEAAEEFKRQLDKMRLRNNERDRHLKRAFEEKLVQMRDEIAENKSNFEKNGPFHNDDNVEAAEKKIAAFKESTEEFRKRIQEMDFGFKLFSINYVPEPALGQVEQDIEFLKLIWNKRKQWDNKWNEMKVVPFRDIDTEMVTEVCKQFLEDINGYEKKIKDWGVTKELKVRIQRIIDNMPIVDILRQPCMRERHWTNTKKLVSNEIFNHMGDHFTLEKFIDLSFDKHTEKINETSENAQAQYKVEVMLTKIKKDWSELNIETVVMPNPNSNPASQVTEIYVVKRDSVTTINNRLEDDMVKLASLKTNLSAAEFEAEIEQWDADLNKVLEAMEILFTVQRKFEYVNNIFNNIQSELNQLAGDYSSFTNVKNDFKIEMDKIQQNPNAKDNLTQDQFKTKFENLSKELDKIQNKLKDLLKQRRSEFARFFFLSDEDMFEMLGNAKNPTVINKHMKKMYEGIKSMTVEEKVIDKNTKQIKFTAMVSPDGEVVTFDEKVEVSGKLIRMMEEIENQMKVSLRSRLKELWKDLNGLVNVKSASGNASGLSFESLIRNYPGQVILLAFQMEWTAKCLQIIKDIYIDIHSSDKGDKDNREGGKQKKSNPAIEKWKDFSARYDDYGKELPKLILNASDKLMRDKIYPLIIVYVHNRDIINDTLKGKCTSDLSFDWTKQLRFEKTSEGVTGDDMNVAVLQGNAKFLHGWEYQGNNERLIITPLTDRCYLTLTTAMNLKKGGCPQGPAGTGKTETVKDLGKNMGRFVFVFNCSEGLDVKSLKSMFEGFCRTGSWSCFDEFNRIEIEVLSVVAIYIKNILDASSMIPQGQELGAVNLDDEMISLNVNCSLFITMNPGYSGRTELPDNLKANFRPISMMAADLELIIRITLMAKGFQSTYDGGKPAVSMFSQKCQTLYILMREQLSKQDHYDFGLRAIKSALELAGKLKSNEGQKNVGKAAKGKQQALDNVSDEMLLNEETKMIIKAIRDLNDPKLVAEDIPLFMALLKDLFPRTPLESKKDRDLSMEIHKVLIENMMDNTDYCVSKVIQLFDCKQTRHGNMLIGKTMSGKSTIHKVLAKAQNNLNAVRPDLYKKVTEYILNPKSITMTELYGYFDSTEDKSHIGVFSYLMEQHCNKSNTPDQKWIIFDGPIDTKWIESMNSLLDDNKLLTLLDGNRINLHPLVSLLFEAEDLKQASPATVSRCGMVYMDVDRLNWDSLRLRWLLQKEKFGFEDMSQKTEDNKPVLGLDEEALDVLEDLFDKWVEPILAAKKAGKIKDAIPLQENHLVHSLLKLLDTFCTKENGLDYSKKSTDEMFWIKFEKWFTYCVIWSIGAAIHEDYRKTFDSMIRGIEDVFPLSQTVYDAYINVEKCEFVKWEDRLTITPANWRPKDPKIARHRFLVDTIDTIRSRYMIENNLRCHHPLLLIGVTGTGKTSIVNSFLSELSDMEYSYNIINLSAQTSSEKLQSIIESKLNTSTKRKFRPHNGKRGVIFIDDLNMPKLDTYGSQPPLELIRQLVEYSGWYDRSNLDNFVEIEKTDLLCAMAPPGGGRNPISNRLSSKFHVVNLTLPSNTQIKRIYTSILNYTTIGFDSDEVRVHIDKVADLIIEFYDKVCSDDQFRPTPQKCHYLFNLRDMSRVVQGMGMVDKDSCDGQNILMKLLLHEHLRVYRDRMVSQEDKEHMRKILDSLFLIHFQTTIGLILDEKEEVDMTDELIFVDFIDAGRVYSEVKQVPAMQVAVEAKLEEYNKFAKVPIDIVFFSNALKNLCRIQRIISMSNGHALLIGEGGSGRHSLSRMATYLAKYQEFQIKIAKNYSSKHFQADIQELFLKIISKDAAYTFIFSDNEITSEGIIEDVNNILSLGEIPNLYQKKEGKDDFQPIRDKLKDKTKRETDEKIYDNFISKIQQKLHIAFCMSQSGTSLRTLSRKYPGLINNTTQIWFEDWTFEALYQVANHYLKAKIDVELPPEEEKAEGEESSDDEPAGKNDDEDGEEERLQRKKQRKLEKQEKLREELKVVKLDLVSKYFSNIHSAVKEQAVQMYEEIKRPFFVTPKSFIDFIKEYLNQVERNRTSIERNQKKYITGLNRMAQAKLDANRIRDEILLKNDEQKRTKKKLDEGKDTLNKEEKIGAANAENLRVKTEQIRLEEEKIRLVEYQCQEELNKVEPILKEANERVAELETQRQAFAEVKALASKKVPAIMVVMKAIMILMGEDPTEDAILKALVTDFVKNLVKPENREELANDRNRFEKFEHFTKGIPADMAKTSYAGDILRKFVIAVAAYIKALKAVMPLKEHLNKLKQKLENLKKEQLELEYKLNKALAHQENLRNQLKASEDELKEAEKKLAYLDAKKNRADDLVKGLEGSGERWEETRKSLSNLLFTIEGDNMLTIAFLNYFSPFPSEYRQKLQAVLMKEIVKSKVPYNPKWNFIENLGDDAQILDWNFKGLPSDQFSVENGVIVMNTVRWPIMIDPQNQACSWIKSLFGDQCFSYDASDPNLMTKIKTGIKSGVTILIENISEEIDPALEPVLARQIRIENGKEYFAIGEESILYNKGFRLFMTTRLSNPTFKAEISTKVTIVNFTVKEKGLEEQLLEELIKIMNNNLEKVRVESIKTKSESEKQLKETEALILKLLEESDGDMTDDINLINTLKLSNETEEKIKSSIATSQANLAKNKIARESYRPLGFIGSILYFTIYNLNKVDVMYQFSLESYVELFKKIVTEKKEDKSYGGGAEAIKEKIESIDVALRKAVYDYACTGIFERDKILLSLQICVNLAEYDEKNKKEKGEEDTTKQKGRKGKKGKKEEDKEGGEEGDKGDGAPKEGDYFKEFFKAEWNFFLKGGVVLSRDNQMTNPDPSWISTAMWDNVTEMDALPNFQGIAGSFTHTNKDWKRFYDSEQPEVEPLPSDWSTKIKGFSLLVLLRAIRPDRITFGATNFVKASLGEPFVKPPTFDIQKIYEGLTKNSPCLFVLSPGADPLSYLENLANDKKATIAQVSLGQKQTERAKEKIRNGRNTGQWVFLANVHLSVDFLKDLDSIIEDIRNNRMDGKASKAITDKLSDDFRLFMTANPSKHFPSSILQKCMKVTTEPPKGIKANMLKLYSNLVKDIFEPKDVKDVKKYSKLLFGLAWFHSLVIERKKFKTLGWNSVYDFNDSDFMFSDKLIRTMVDITSGKGANQTIQWDAIRFIIAEVNYGGRVTDQWDRRLLIQYANEIFVEDMFNTEKLFILSNYRAETEYKMPKEIIDEMYLTPVVPGQLNGPRASGMNVICKDYIEATFPNIEVPAVFGSHVNAEVTSQKMEAAILLDSLLSLQPREASSGSKSREAGIIALVEDRMKKLPEEINYLEARAKNPPTEEDPLRNVLLQEISRYNSVLAVVKSTFVELIAGLKGQTLISEAMEIVFQNISDNKVPERFKFAYLSVKPLISWLDDLTFRFDQMRNWAFKGTPLTFWLGGFAYPTGFTTALKQKAFRSIKDKNTSVDNFKWDFAFIKSDVQAPAPVGAYITDIYLEGAQWTADDFITEEHSMSLYSKIPTLQMKPVEKVSRARQMKYYNCPVYYYPIREGTRENPSYLFELSIPMNPELDEAYFIKKGTACLLNLGD
jgi:dynein heavy chain